jgi:hypothetical protein
MCRDAQSWLAFCGLEVGGNKNEGSRNTLSRLAVILAYSFLGLVKLLALVTAGAFLVQLRLLALPPFVLVFYTMATRGSRYEIAKLNVRASGLLGRLTDDAMGVSFSAVPRRWWWIRACPSSRSS